MKRRKNHEPPVLKRSKKGAAYAYVGNRQKYFGSYEDPETHKRFAHFLQLWEANGGQAPPEPQGVADLTCETLVALYLSHCEKHYRRPDGRPTGEAQQVAYTAKPMLDLYRKLPASSFTIHCLKRVRQEMVESGLSRKTVNQRVWRIRRMFRWAAEEEHVGPEILASLAVLRSLQEGRTDARETEKVRAVSEEHFQQILPFLRTPVRAMAEFQWWTGARPGEVRELRTRDISQMDQRVWLYEPPIHKTSHRNKKRFSFRGEYRDKADMLARSIQRRKNGLPGDRFTACTLYRVFSEIGLDRFEWSEGDLVQTEAELKELVLRRLGLSRKG